MSWNPEFLAYLFPVQRVPRYKHFDQNYECVEQSTETICKHTVFLSDAPAVKNRALLGIIQKQSRVSFVHVSTFIVAVNHARGMESICGRIAIGLQF